MTSNGQHEAKQLHNLPQDAGVGSGARSNGHTIGANTREGSEAVEQGSRAAGEASRRTSEAAAETTRRSMQALAESQRQIVRDAAEQVQEASLKVAQAVQGAAGNMRALMTLPNVTQGGLDDLRQSSVSLFEGIVRTNVRATQELFRLYNPGALIELQQRFAQEYVSVLVEGSATVVRAARRTADETLRPLEQQAEQRRQAGEDEQRYQHAAE